MFRKKILASLVIGVVTTAQAVQVIEKQVEEETPIASQVSHVLLGVQLGGAFATHVFGVSAEDNETNFTKEADVNHNSLSGLFFGYQFNHDWIAELEYLYMPFGYLDIDYAGERYHPSSDSRLDALFANAVYLSTFLTEKYRPYASLGLGMVFSDITLSRSFKRSSLPQNNDDSSLAVQLKIGFTKKFYESVVCGFNYGYMRSFQKLQMDIKDDFGKIDNSGRYSTQFISARLGMRF